MLNLLLNPFSLISSIDGWISDRFRAKSKTFILGGIFLLTILHFAGMLLYMGSSSVLLFNLMFYLKLSFEFLAYIAFTIFLIVILKNFARLFGALFPSQKKQARSFASSQFFTFLKRTNLYDFAIFAVLFIFVFPLIYFYPLWKTAFLTWAIFLSLILVLGGFIYIVYRSEPRVGQMANDVTKLVEDAGELIDHARDFLLSEVDTIADTHRISGDGIRENFQNADLNFNTQRENISNVIADTRALLDSLQRVRGIISASLILFFIGFALWVGYFHMESYLETNKMRVRLDNGQSQNLGLILSNQNGFLFRSLKDDGLYFISADEVSMMEVLH